MKIILVTLLLLSTFLSFAQDPSPSDSQSNQGNTSNMNKDAENEEVELSEEVDNLSSKPNPILDVKDVKTALDLLERRPTI